MPIIYPQLDGVKVNEDRSLPIALIQAIRKAYDYLATGVGGGTSDTGTGGGGGGGGGGGTSVDAIGPVTGFTSAGEVGTRYAGDQVRSVHLTIGFAPICPVPQSVTYLLSLDNGVSWVWVGSQRVLTTGQVLLVDYLAPSEDSSWQVAAVAGNLGGDPSPILDANLSTKYPGVVRSSPFFVAGLAVPGTNSGITATIGSQINVLSADGFTQYGVITGVPYNGGIVGMVYTDPIGTTDFFVRITTQILDSSHAPLAAEEPHGGTQITGGSHSEPPELITYVPALAYVRYRIYTANRNSQGAGDFSDPTTNTLQMVKYNSNPVLANHYDVPITIPPFTPIDPGTTFNVTSVTASEVGPKYQDQKAGLHTSVGIIPVIDHDYSSPRTVTIWLDFGTGTPVWQGWFSLTVAGQVVRIGDQTVNTQGVTNSGDIYVPTNPTQSSWIVYCGAGRIDDGVNPSAYQQFIFTVTPAVPCLPNGTTNAQFLSDPSTGNQIVYSLWDPGIWYWEYFELTWTPPSLAFDPNYWFTMITVQKGATISGVWTPAPDSEGVNEDPQLNFLGRVHIQVLQLPGVSNDQSAVIRKFGAKPATWVIPPLQNPDGSTNPYREFRFLAYNVSRLGTDTSGSGGVGTYTLQTSCWPSNADHYILIPQPQTSALDLRAANPLTVTLPLVGGNGQPLTVSAYSPGTPGTGIGAGYLGPSSVHAVNMANSSITVANDALDFEAVIDQKIKTLGINKVTYGVSVFAGDVVLSRGTGNPVIYLKIATSGPDPRQNPTGIYLFGQGNATDGKTGLTTQPYVLVQSTAIGLFQGGTVANPGGSVIVDASAAAITIYNRNGDLTFPYFTVSATGLAMVNGVNSFAVNANAMSLIDKQFHNRVDMSSAGIVLTNGLDASGNPTATANQMKITAAQLQLLLAGSPRITIDSANGIVLSNGGGSSVTLTSSLVQIVNGTLINNSGTVTIYIDQTNYVRVLNTASGQYGQLSHAYCRVISNSDAAYFSSLELGLVSVGGPSSVGHAQGFFSYNLIRCDGLPSSNPGAGTRQLYYNPATGAVFFAV